MWFLNRRRIAGSAASIRVTPMTIAMTIACVIAALLGETVVAHATLTGAWTGEGNVSNALYGYSVNTAGDVNGDGYSDLMIGAPGILSNRGRVLVYHGAPSGVSIVQWTADGTTPLGLFGSAVSTAGDVNADSYDDVIIGASKHANGQANEGRIAVYLGSAAGLSSAWNLTLELDQAQALLGTSVAGAGDVDGDGYDDVLYGAEGWDGTFLDGGRVGLLYGGPSGVNPNGGFAFNGMSAGAQLGASVSTAGDLNADGYKDIVAGAPGANRVYVFLGGPAGPPAAPSVILAGAIGSRFGASVSTAGDMNGDGYADLIVGGPEESAGQANEGRAHIYLGSASGVNTIPVWSGEGNAAGAHYGAAVAAAGDVNGDGYADVVVGAKDLTDGQAGEGRCVLYHGSATGPYPIATWLSDGSMVGAHLGFSCATAGDVNGDGHNDVVAAGPWASNPEVSEGRVAVWHGSADPPSQGLVWMTEMNQEQAQYGRALTLGDFNGDGYADAVTATGLFDNGAQIDAGRVWMYLGTSAGVPIVPSWTMGGGAPQVRFGDAVGAAGDVNGDGYDDLLVGAPYHDNLRGAAYLFRGGASGLSAAPVWTVLGELPGDRFGASVAAAADVNGDGLGDVVIGAPFHRQNFMEEGKGYVFLGSPAGLATTPVWTAVGGQASARLGWDVATAGDVNGDGYWDIVLGMPFYDHPQIDEGAALVYRGAAGGIDQAGPWLGESNQPGAQYGYAVASAGDVNGDHYSDVVIGAPLFDGQLANQGFLFLHRGGAAGLETSAFHTITITHLNAQLGMSVVAADLNHDGLSDVVGGAPYVDNGQQDEGQVLAFVAPFGPGPSPLYWGVDGNAPIAWHGMALAAGGDVNGDGFGDVLSASPGHENPHVEEGLVYLWPGNGKGIAGYGLDRRPRHGQPDNVTPLALLGQSVEPDEFRLKTYGRTALGRDRIRIVLEVKRYGVPFDGTETVDIGPLDTGVPVLGVGSRVVVSRLVSGLMGDSVYRWRLRFTSEDPRWPRSPWFTPEGNAWTETDLRTRSGSAGIAANETARARIPLAGRPTVFSESTTLAFALARTEAVRLSVYDVLGRHVQTLVDGPVNAGTQVIAWNGSDHRGRRLAAGVYFAVLESSGGRSAARLVLTR